MPGENTLKIFMVVGEESGDQLGAKLMDGLAKKAGQPIRYSGTAGHRMEARGATSIFPLEDIAVMGLSAVLARLPTIVRRVYQTVAAAESFQPDVVVLIDSPDFTHQVGKRIRKKMPHVPIIDYVSPSVWAWRPGRAKKMARFIDHLLALLPFEPDAHKRLSGPETTYVGHPLIEKLDVLRPGAGEKPALEATPTMLILPGSRMGEITRLMEPFGQVVAAIAGKNPQTRFIIPAVSHVRKEIESHMANWPVKAELVDGEEAKFTAFRTAHAALAASGTVTLELALAGVPMVVAYKLDPLAKRLKWLGSVPSIVLPNLILQENAIPEFIDDDCTPENLLAALAPLLENTEVRADQITALQKLDSLMALDEGETPSARAAGIVASFLPQQHEPH